MAGSHLDRWCQVGNGFGHLNGLTTETGYQNTSISARFRRKWEMVLRKIDLIPTLFPVCRADSTHFGPV
ncbi:MAG TPA: hypothetical protein DIC41_02930 [Alphaproteobacteria bacterium]|nr:MAG: hypothetical protein CNE92_05080 [SAR116 cluster bacterium MED-G05]HCA13534.1 hypothetical protein [Alphaproteobacteria bacterium]HCM07388.1 hypothetical protein [Alphaproteobacteria bacterium]